MEERIYIGKITQLSIGISLGDDCGKEIAAFEDINSAREELARYTSSYSVKWTKTGVRCDVTEYCIVEYEIEIDEDGYVAYEEFINYLDFAQAKADFSLVECRNSLSFDENLQKLIDAMIE